jgi:hypothetical protein
MKYISFFCLLFLIACRPTPGAKTQTRGDSTEETGGTESREIGENTKSEDTSSEKKANGENTSPSTIRDISEEKASNATIRATDEAQAYDELSKPNRIRAWVNGLIVKQYPGNNMPKIATMKEGEEAEYLYQRTFLSAEYVFKGQKIRDAWYLIRTHDDIIGWVHGGGMKFVPTAGNGNDANAQEIKSDAINTTTQKITNDWIFVPGKRVGSIYKNTAETQLVELFGPDNVQRGEIVTTGGKKENCSFVYKGTPDELAITWKDLTRTKINAVYLTNRSGKWHSQEGIKTGLSLTDLAKLNEAPFTFYGFDWEYGGTIGGWKNGKISKFSKGFYVVLQYNAANTPKEFIQKAKGNQVFSSTSELAKAMDIAVKRIVVYLD